MTEFFSSLAESLTRTAFPQLSKFMDFSSPKQDEAKAGDKASDAERDLGTSDSLSPFLQLIDWT